MFYTVTYQDEEGTAADLDVEADKVRTGEGKWVWFGNDAGDTVAMFPAESVFSVVSQETFAAQGA